MWVVVNDGSVEIVSNKIEHDILGGLIENYPTARIYKAEKNCINEVNALRFQVVYEPGALVEFYVPVLDEEGKPVYEPELNESGQPILNSDGEPVFSTRPKFHVVEEPGPQVSVIKKTSCAVEADAFVLRDEDSTELYRCKLDHVH